MGHRLRRIVHFVCAVLFVAVTSSLAKADEVSVGKAIEVALEAGSVPASTRSLDIRATYVHKGEQPAIAARGMNIDFLRKHSYWLLEISFSPDKERKGKIVRCIDSETGRKLL